MIRQIHTFQYYWKIFKVWDLRVRDYMLFLVSWKEAISNIFLEFNTDIPLLSEEQMEKFLEILFWKKEKAWKKNIEVDVKEEYEDIEYFVALFAKNLQQNIETILNLPLEAYFRIFSRIEEIMDTSKYKKKTKKPDRKWINEIKNILNTKSWN